MHQYKKISMRYACPLPEDINGNETKLITCESPTTLDMRSRRIRHGNTQQRCLCASSFCIREVFIEALSSRRQSFVLAAFWLHHEKRTDPMSVRRQ